MVGKSDTRAPIETEALPLFAPERPDTTFASTALTLRSSSKTAFDAGISAVRLQASPVGETVSLSTMRTAVRFGARVRCTVAFGTT